MPKYLLQVSYTSEGMKGLAQDSAAGRRADVQASVRALGGNVEAFYYCFGKDDVLTIVELPDNITAAALSLKSSQTGALRIRTTPLLTVEEVDRALEIDTHYRAPGE